MADDTMTRERLQAQAVRNGWVEGVPMPVDGLSVQLCDSHPLKIPLEAILDKREAPQRVCTDADVREDVFVRNRWWSSRYCAEVGIVQDGARVRLLLWGHNDKATMLLDTMKASDAWDLEAETVAMQKLLALVTDRAFGHYVLTGAFLETSPRSGVTYLFRRLRPTLALGRTREGNIHILCALCLHPLGFYKGTWAGCMVPTDDVIAHLLLMRGDEPRLWRQAEQHAAHEAAAGIF